MSNEEVQRVLVKLGAKLKVDGVIGVQTSLALLDLSVLETRVLNMFVKVGSGRFMAKYIPVMEVDSLIDQITDVMNVQHLARAAKFSLRKEARQRRSSEGELLVDVDSRSGSYKGLFQFGEAAWADAAKTALELGVDIGSYSNVYSPEYNIAAMVAYLRRSEIFLKRKGLPVTQESLYLSHNQGLGFWSGKRTNVEGQSVSVRELIARYA